MLRVLEEAILALVTNNSPCTREIASLVDLAFLNQDSDDIVWAVLSSLSKCLVCCPTTRTQYSECGALLALVSIAHQHAKLKERVESGNGEVKRLKRLNPQRLFISTVRPGNLDGLQIPSEAMFDTPEDGRGLVVDEVAVEDQRHMFDRFGCFLVTCLLLFCTLRVCLQQSDRV